MAQDRVEAVERALTILAAFDSSQEHFTLAELAAVTGFYKSTLLRLLGSLERFGYVQRGSEGRYRLGHAPMRLARRHLPSRQLETWIQPALDDLASISGETASLLEIVGESAECRLVAIPDAPLRHELRPGTRWKIVSSTAPALDFDGGVMICRHLMTSEALPLWLAISGPSSRIDADTAESYLTAALAELARSPGNEID